MCMYVYLYVYIGVSAIDVYSDFLKILYVYLCICLLDTCERLWIY